MKHQVGGRGASLRRLSPTALKRVINAVGGLILGANLVAAVAIHDDLANGIRFAFAEFPVNEQQERVVVKVRRDFDSAGTATVSYSCEDGAAVAGRDYGQVSGTLTFADGQFTNSFSVPVYDNRRRDRNRSFTVLLRSGAGDEGGARECRALVTILDDESPIVITEAREDWLRAALFGGGNDVRFECFGTILVDAPINISSRVTIDAQPGAMVISGGGVSRMFNVAPKARATFKNLTFVDGFSTNGGAIWNEGELVLIACAFSNNMARGADGMIGTNGVTGPSGSGSPGDPATGGALVNFGTVLATGCVFIANSAIGGEGGAGGSGASVTNSGQSFFEGGPGAPGGSAQGGAVWSAGELLFVDSTFGLNDAVAGNGGSGGDGGVLNVAYGSYGAVGGIAGEGGNSIGGALCSERPLRLVGCDLSGNSAIAGQGGTGGSARGPMSASPPLGASGGIAAGGAVFAIGLGVVETSRFRTNQCVGGAGGGGGRGAAIGQHTKGGAGARGGNGGHALGGGLFATNRCEVSGSWFEENIAQAGAGGGGGSGGGEPNSMVSGVAGSGGLGGDGGDALAGGLGIAAKVSAVTASTFVSNRAFGGNGGGGGGPGGGGNRYTTAGSGGSGGSGGKADGGALWVLGNTAQLNGSVFQSNSAIAGAGGYPAFGARTWSGTTFSAPAGSGGVGGAGGLARGGAVFADARLKTANTIIEGNTAVGGDGSWGGKGGHSKSKSGNGGAPGAGGDARGGAVYSVGDFSSSHLTFSGNSSVGGHGGGGGSGGSVYPGPSNKYGSAAAGGSGGRAAAGALYLEASGLLEAGRLEANSAVGGNGGNAGVNGGQAFGTTASYICCEVTGNYGVSPQGGLAGPALGGAIVATGPLVMVSMVTASANSAVAGAAGATGPGGWNFGWYRVETYGTPAKPGVSGAEASGGAVYSSGSTIIINASTFSSNRVAAGTGGFGGSRAQTNDTGGAGGPGGVATGGALAGRKGRLAITNSTFYANTVAGGIGGVGGSMRGGAPGGAGGNGAGGALLLDSVDAIIVNASFAENGVVVGPGGNGGAGETNTMGVSGLPGAASAASIASALGSVALWNSLFKPAVGNTNADGLFVDRGANISSDDSFKFTHLLSRNRVDPLVGSLADNGGPTLTLELLSGSPALDSAIEHAAPPVDQRGVRRPYNRRSDIGAFELNEPTFSIAGRVTERSGVAGVLVTAGSATAVTDAYGHYILTKLRAGSHPVAPRLSYSAIIEPDRRMIAVGPSAQNVDFSISTSRLGIVAHEGRPEEFVVLPAGLPERDYLLETSTNLIDWTVVKRIRTDAAGAGDTLRAKSGEPKRFYRLRP